MKKSSAEHRPPLRKVPKQARSLETVSVIIEAAARILEDQGHGGFSTNAVAERAGVSIGSLYQYFPSKEALMGALIARETSLLLKDALAASERIDGQGALRDLIAACVTHQLRRPQLARLLDFEEARLPFDVDMQQVKDRMLGIALDMIDRSDFPAQPDLITGARDVLSIIKGIIDSAGVDGETDQPHLAARVERAVFGYLGSGRR